MRGRVGRVGGRTWLSGGRRGVGYPGQAGGCNTVGAGSRWGPLRGGLLTETRRLVPPRVAHSQPLHTASLCRTRAPRGWVGACVHRWERVTRHGGVDGSCSFPKTIEKHSH